MEQALASAGLAHESIDYINAHATSTPVGDEIESSAISEVFGGHAKSRNLAISSTKGAIGHLLGAAGAVEASFAIMAVKEVCRCPMPHECLRMSELLILFGLQDICPPTVNLDDMDESSVGNYVANNSQSKLVRAALSNSFGFGGTNASLAFAKAPTVTTS